MNKEQIEIDYNFEKKYLEEYLRSLKLLNFYVYQKMKRTGILATQIGNALGIEDKEYYFAGFYANISKLSIDKMINNHEFLYEKELEQVKRHPAIATEILRNKRMLRAADYVYYHHELPDGSGYYKIDNYPIESCYINIADIFEGAITNKPYRIALTLSEALKITLKPYENGLKINLDDLKTIKNVLIDFYNNVSEF
jgi:HD-GYP domain-containing protein (c-di-GMP phosphodiesterase class II)